MPIIILSWFTKIEFLFVMQESLLRCGKEAILHKSNELEQKEVMKKFGQTGLVVGVFVVAAFTVKQIFV